MIKSHGKAKSVSVLVEDIAYVLPPIDPDADVRTWTSANGKFTVDAAMASKSADAVYLQRGEGIVISVKTDSLSKQDQSYVESNAEKSTDCLACSGKAVEIVLPENTPADRAAILKGLRSSLARSGYSVSPNANLKLAVSFVEGETEENEMYGLNGKQILKFTPWTTTVDFRRDSTVLWNRTHTTKSPYTLPGGKAGVEKLKRAEEAMVPFLRTLGIPAAIRRPAGDTPTGR